MPVQRRVSLATVYRSLRLLSSLGLLQELELPEGGRRFELAQFDRAADTWSFMVNRHLYREEDAAGRVEFLNSKFIPALGNVRVIESVKDLGVIALKP